MGLFSSKRVTRVGTTASRLIKDEDIPNSVNTGILKSLIEGGDLVEEVLEETLTSMGVRGDRMYQYAENHYVHGSPSGDVFSSTQGKAQVEAVIETLEGAQVVLEYSHYGPPNTLHVGWTKLVSEHGYVQSTNQLGALTTIKGVPVYLKDMVVVVPASQQDSFELGSLDQWGTAARGGYTPQRPSSVGALVGLVTPSPPTISDVATTLHLLVTYVWQPVTVPATPLQQGSFTINLDGIDETADYFHAKYLINDVYKYWMYKNKSGTYPSLDEVYVDAPVASGSYFPFAYFRYNKQSVITNKTTPAYLTTRRMLKYLNIDFDDLAQGIDENPDIGDVEQALLTMSVPAVSTNAIENKYLFEYFDNLHLTMDGTALPSIALLQGLVQNEDENQKTIVIKDAQFKMALHNRGIYKRIVSGSIGPIGTHTSVYESVDVEVQTDDEPIIQQMNIHKYRRQIVVGLYEEILVRDLRMTYFIFEGHNSTADEDDPILLIPLDHSITEKYSIAEKEILYTRSLHLVFNSVTVTKLRWYQTGIFQVLMLVVSVLVTIFTGGMGAPLIASALGLSGVALLVAVVIVNQIIGLLIGAAIKLFVKAVGIKNSIFAVIALMVAAVASGVNNISNGLIDAGKILAKDLLWLSSNLVSLVLQQKNEELLGDYKTFQEQSKASTAALEDANKLLNTDVRLNPMIIFGEKPDDFFNRTVHSGNIGTLSITAISSYVDIALTLPNIHDTLGKESYDLES